MKDLPSCFGENGIQVADFTSSNSATSSKFKPAQNVVTCVYHCKLHGKSCWITVIWSKNLMGQGFSIGIDDRTHQSLCKVDIKPWLFSKKKGSKTLEAVDSSKRIEVYWDLSAARYGSAPEPLEGFYVGIVFEKKMVLLLGDMRKEAFKKTGSVLSQSVGSVFVSKKEHVFGKKVFRTKARFSGEMSSAHDLVIECDTSGAIEPWLAIRLDSKPIMQVKRLRWKFRGNDTILVDGFVVEVFWDVHNWLFGNSLGNAVFMFRTRESDDKLWTSQQPLCDPHELHWSWSQRFRDAQLQGLGFSLILHAWKNE